MSPQTNTELSFTKRLFLFALVGTASIFLIKGIYALGMVEPQDSATDERKLKSTEFENMPVRVEKVKNLQSDKWNEDLEIEVKNVSTKAVYFILAYLTFPDDKEAQSVGFGLTFGKRENIRIRNIADPEDPHLDPGETYVFAMPEIHKRGFQGRHKRFPHAYQNFQFDIHLVSFGDGTGWEWGQPRDKRKKTSLLLTPKSPESKKK